MEKILDTNIVHESKNGRFELVTVLLPSGKTATYEQWVRPDGVVIMALDGNAKAGNIVMTKEWRFAAQKVQWDLPRGHIEEGETPKQAARRELKEETGFSAQRFTRIHIEEPASGWTKARSHFFVAEGLKPGARVGGDEEHDIEVVVMPLAEVFRLAFDEVAIEPPFVLKALLVLRKWLREQGRV